jgi:hypothetical protein
LYRDGILVGQSASEELGAVDTDGFSVPSIGSGSLWHVRGVSKSGLGCAKPSSSYNIPEGWVEDSDGAAKFSQTFDQCLQAVGNDLTRDQTVFAEYNSQSQTCYFFPQCSTHVMREGSKTYTLVPNANRDPSAFVGRLDEMRIWKRVLSRNTIERNFFVVQSTMRLFSKEKESGESSRSAAESCSSIKQNNQNAKSGLYWIHLNEDELVQDPLRVYCDMETDGGGWTLLFKQLGGFTLRDYTRLSDTLGNEKYWSSQKLMEGDTNLANAEVGPSKYLDAPRFNKKAFDILASRKGMEWLKYQHAFEGKAKVLDQGIRLEMGRNTLQLLSMSEEAAQIW